MSQSHAVRSVRLAALVFAGVFALISLASSPTPKFARWLAAQGLGPELAGMLLHVLPVVVSGLATYGAGMWALRLRSPVWKGVVRGGAGMLVGVGLGLCLDAFSALAPIVTALLGPSLDGGFGVIIGWVEGALFFTMGLTLAGLHVFGRSAVEVMNLGPVSDLQLPATRKERLDSKRAAGGLLLMGFGLCALLLCVQAQAASALMRGVLAGVAVLGLGWSTWLCWVQYRNLDEAMRLAVLRAYALSGAGACVIFTVWALAESFLPVAAPTALDVLVLLVALQWACMILTLKSTFGLTQCEPEESAPAAPVRVDA